MKRFFTSPVFDLIIRLVVGGLFIYASVYKILSPGAFAHQIYNYKLLPAWAINPLGITLPWIQLFCGVALLVNRWRVAAGVLLLAMMIVFQAAVGSALVRGLNISCGCFKSGGGPATWMTFLRDFGFLVLTAVHLVSARWNQKDNRETI